MPDILTWGALIAASGSLIAVIKFWMDRGKAEADTRALASSAHASAIAALARIEMISGQLTEVRIEFSRDYATHKDVALSEERLALAINDFRNELRGMNTRLDRVIENFPKQV